MSDVKKEYESLKKKYNLPDYDSIDNEFELLYIGEIKEIKFPLRFIRRRINDKIALICNMVQTLIQPNPGSIINLQESGFLSKEDKLRYTHLLKDLMETERTSLRLDFDFDERKDAVFIKEALKKWTEYKQEIVKLTDKLIEGWKKLEIKKEQKDRYFG